MALLPEVHLDLRQLTFVRAYEIFLPLVPGGTLVGGLVLAHPASIDAAAISVGMGRYARGATLVCAAYIAGLILYGLSVLVTGICTGILGRIVFAKWPPKRPNLAASQTFLFRRVAAEFLGKSLSPPAPALPTPPLAGNDIEWQDWYNILQDYVLRDSWARLSENVLLFVHLQATGWALIYLRRESVMFRHGAILAVSVALIAAGAAMPFLFNYNYWKNDRLPAWDFLARLIRDLRTRDKKAVDATE